MATAPVPTPETPSFEALVAELNHRIWEVRRDACEDLTALNDKRAVPYLVRMLRDGVGAVRFAAAEALGKLRDPSVVPDLLRILDDPLWGAYGPVIESLAALRAKVAIPFFIRYLRDKDTRIRNVASSALMVVTRQVIPFKAKGPEEEREQSVKLWETWWQKNKATF